MIGLRSSRSNGTSTTIELHFTGIAVSREENRYVVCQRLLSMDQVTSLNSRAATAMRSGWHGRAEDGESAESENKLQSMRELLRCSWKMR